AYAPKNSPRTAREGGGPPQQKKTREGKPHEQLSPDRQSPGNPHQPRPAVAAKRNRDALHESGIGPERRLRIRQQPHFELRKVKAATDQQRNGIGREQQVSHKENAGDPACPKCAKEVSCVAIIQQDAADQKSREHKKQVNTTE